MTTKTKPKKKAKPAKGKKGKPKELTEKDPAFWKNNPLRKSLQDPGSPYLGGADSGSGPLGKKGT